MPKWAVQAPDGKIIQFPDTFTEADVNREMGKMYGGAQSTSTIKAAPAVGSGAWAKEKLYNTVDTVTGFIPAAGATAGAILGAAGGPLGSAAGATIGGGGGEAAKQLVRRALGYEVPQTSGQAAEAIGREGVTQGAVQLAAGGLGKLATKLAPKMAESALGVSETLRGRGRTIGQAMLDETSAIRPGPLLQQTKQKIASLTAEMENGVQQATANGAVGTTQPAHAVLDAAIAKTPRNARAVIEKLDSLRNSLELDAANPRMVHTPDELLEIKRGIGQEINSWPPEWKRLDAVKAVQQRLYGAIDGELDRVVPGNAELNQTISSLIPGSQRLARINDGAPLLQRIAHRAKAPTGALFSAGFGGAAGYREGGVPGALAGAAAGLVAPDVLLSPTSQMLAARTLAAAPTIGRYAMPVVRYGASRLSDELLSPQKP